MILHESWRDLIDPTVKGIGTKADPKSQVWAWPFPVALFWWPRSRMNSWPSPGKKMDLLTKTGAKWAGRRAPQQLRGWLLPVRASPTGRNRNTIKLSQKTCCRKCNYSKIQINVQRKLAPDRVSQASKSSWRQAAQANSPRRRTAELEALCIRILAGWPGVHHTSQATSGEEPFGSGWPMMQGSRK